MIGNLILIGYLIAGIIAAYLGSIQFAKDMNVPCQWGCEG